MKNVSALVMCLALSGQAQVLDVNGDDTVGAEEALAVAESWKGTPATPNDHDHLGQTWKGNRRPLTIRGYFPDRIMIPLPKSEGKGTSSSLIPSAPLILDNTAMLGNLHRPDLLLNGRYGILGALDQDNSELHLYSNYNIAFILDDDNNNDGDQFSIVTNNGIAFILDEVGNLSILGDLNADNVKTRSDHPVDPNNKDLIHASVQSPEMKNIYDGVVTLDGSGEAWVQLPSYFEAFNTDFRYQLTCLGGYAPIYVAEEIQENRFKLAGGTPGLRVSWQVTGARNDAYAKANPVRVEREKERGKYLHPELLGEAPAKGLSKVGL